METKQITRNEVKQHLGNKDLIHYIVPFGCLRGTHCCTAVQNTHFPLGTPAHDLLMVMSIQDDAMVMFIQDDAMEFPVTILSVPAIDAGKVLEAARTAKADLFDGIYSVLAQEMQNILPEDTSGIYTFLN